MNPSKIMDLDRREKKPEKEDGLHCLSSWPWDVSPGSAAAAHLGESWAAGALSPYLSVR